MSIEQNSVSGSIAQNNNPHSTTSQSQNDENGLGIKRGVYRCLDCNNTRRIYSGDQDSLGADEIIDCPKCSNANVVTS